METLALLCGSTVLRWHWARLAAFRMVQDDLRRFVLLRLHLWSICRWHLAAQSAPWSRLARSSRVGRAVRACRELHDLGALDARVVLRLEVAWLQMHGLLGLSWRLMMMCRQVPAEV